MSKLEVVSRIGNNLELGIPGAPNVTVQVKLARANKNSVGKDKGRLVNVTNEVVVTAEVPVILADGSVSREVISVRRRNSGSSANPKRMLAIAAFADAISQATFTELTASGYAIDRDALAKLDAKAFLNVVNAPVAQ